MCFCVFDVSIIVISVAVMNLHYCWYCCSCWCWCPRNYYCCRLFCYYYYYSCNCCFILLSLVLLLLLLLFSRLPSLSSEWSFEYWASMLFHGGFVILGLFTRFSRNVPSIEELKFQLIIHSSFTINSIYD